MAQPFEIIAAPYTVYLAPVGEAMPDVGAVPAGNWFKLGAAGAKNYSEDGVSVQHAQSIELFRMLGATGPVKASRTSEDLKVSFVLHDLTLEQYRKVLNDLTVSATAAGSGTAGIKSMPLLRGLEVAEYAVLVRGDVSPEGEGFASQYELPRMIVTSEPEVVFRKNEPAGLAIELTALEDSDAAAGSEFGRLVVQAADAL